MPTRILRIIGAVFVAALLVAACGDDDTTIAQTGGSATDDSATETPDDAATDDTGSDGSSPPAEERETSLGPTLADADGYTLYAFTPDEGGAPTCVDACADTWPPLFLDTDELPESLDPTVYSVVEHPSGSPQLAAGGWPLYTYAPDTEPDDVNGQGVGGNWFAVAPDGSLIEDAASAGGGTDEGSSEEDGSTDRSEY